MDFFKSHLIFLTTVILFFVFLPLSLSIDFMQNDDWNRYQTVGRFMQGDFRLLEVTATTFYTQGFIGLAFAKMFTVEKLPILTLIFGSLNFLIFSLICNRFLKITKFKSVIVSLVVFFNPLHFYSLFGFMTEVYLLTFSLAAVYFYLGSFQQNKYSQFVLANIYWILGFFAKQWGIVFPAAFIGHQILRRKWKSALIQLLILLAVLGYYFFYFPTTYEMAEQKSFEPRNYESLKYIFNHGYAYFVSLSVFCLPFVWGVILRNLKKISNQRKILVVGGAAILSFAAKIFFNSTNYPWKTFPLYPNVFTEKGFFLAGIEGEAQSSLYAPMIDLFDEVGLFSIVLLALLLLFRKKLKPDLLNFEFITVLTGFFLIIGTPFVFDRYLLVFIPLTIIFLIRLAGHKINLWFVCIYLLAQSFISLDYAIEYVNRQQLIWNHAEQIHVEEGVPREEIIASHAWNKFYKLNTDKAVYWFRYSDPLDSEDERVAREFWSQGIFTKTNLDIIRIETRY